MFAKWRIRQHGEGASLSGGAKKARPALAVVARGGVVVAGLVGRKADAFAALLDGSSKAGTADPSLANLAKITQRLSSVPQPSPAFKAALRQQLVHAASTTAAAGPTAGALHVPHPRVSPGHGAGASGAAGSGASGTSSAIMGLGKAAPIWIKIFSGIAAATVAGTGVGVGAHRALPGDPFYGIKKQVEAVQLDLASGTAGKAKARFGFAHARINELKQLIANEHITPTSQLSSATEGHIRGLLQAWAVNAGVATTSLIEEIRGLGSKESTAKLSAELRQLLASFTTNQFGQLGGLLASVPVGPLQSLTVSALGYLQRVDGVLGGNPATLIQQLPIPLTAIPNLQAVIPQLNLPVGTAGSLPNLGSVLSGAKGGIVIPNPLPSAIASAGSTVPKALASLHIPTTIPTIGVPKTGPTGIALPSPSVTGILPSDSALKGVLKDPLGTVLGGLGGSGSGGTGSGGTGAITGVTGSLGGAVSGVGGAVSSVGGGNVVGSVGGAVSSAGATVDGVTGSVGKTVTGLTGGTGSTGSTGSGSTSGASGGNVIGTVTGGLSSSSGPALPLPTALPTLPPLPKIPGLGG
jgi:Domain of unknown function (DUF5667)